METGGRSLPEAGGVLKIIVHRRVHQLHTGKKEAKQYYGSLLV